LAGLVSDADGIRLGGTEIGGPPKTWIIADESIVELEHFKQGDFGDALGDAFEKTISVIEKNSRGNLPDVDKKDEDEQDPVIKTPLSEFN
jgi:hypothetical protein